MSIKINNYLNPNRSDHLIAALKNFENTPKKNWEGQNPKFYQTAQKMHCFGKIFLGFGITLAIAAIIVPITSTQLSYQVTIGGIVGGCALATAGIAVFLLLKSYWNDPTYLQQKREEMLDCLILQGFNEAEKKYGQDNYKRQLISQSEIDYIMNKHYQMDEKTVSEIKSDIRNSDYITREILNRAFLKEFQNKNFNQLIVIADNKDSHLIDDNKEKIQQKFIHEISNVNCIEVFKNYNFDLLNKKGLLNGIEHVIRQKLLEETKSLSLAEIYQSYNDSRIFWNFFKLKILHGMDFRKKAEKELSESSLINMLKKYGHGLFEYELLDINLLSISTCKQMFSEMTFVEFYENFSAIPLPFEWNQKAAKLAREYDNATTEHFEPISGEHYDSSGQGRYKLIKPQNPTTLAKTVTDINRRWAQFISRF